MRSTRVWRVCRIWSRLRRRKRVAVSEMHLRQQPFGAQQVVPRPHDLRQALAQHIWLSQDLLWREVHLLGGEAPLAAERARWVH